MASFPCLSVLAYIPMFRVRICFSGIMSPITILSLTLLCTRWNNRMETRQFLISLLFESQILGNFPKTLLLVSWAKIQYTRDGEGPDL